MLLPQVARSWRALNARDALWRAVWTLRPAAAALPRRPRGALRSCLLRAEREQQRRATMVHDELLRKAYVGFCQCVMPPRAAAALRASFAADRAACRVRSCRWRRRDSVPHLRTLLARFPGPLDVNHAQSVMEGNTLVNLAARCGALRCVKELCANGASLDAADVGGFTPLINAAWRGDAPMARWLLAAGADAAARGSSQGRGPATAAEWAHARGHTKLAEELQAAQEAVAAQEADAADDFCAGNA